MGKSKSTVRTIGIFQEVDDKHNTSLSLCHLFCESTTIYKILQHSFTSTAQQVPRLERNETNQSSVVMKRINRSRSVSQEQEYTEHVEVYERCGVTPPHITPHVTPHVTRTHRS